MKFKIYDLGDEELHTEAEFKDEIAAALDDYEIAVDEFNSLPEPEEYDDIDTWEEYRDAERQVEECEKRLEELHGIMEDNPPAQENEATRALEDWWTDRETDEPTDEEIEHVLNRQF